MPQHYRNYTDEDIALLIREIEEIISNGQAVADDYHQLALLENELEEREWVS